MKDSSEIVDKLIEFRAGQLTEEERAFVEDQIKNSIEWKRALEELSTLEDLMSSIPETRPSLQLRHNFEDLLSKEKLKTQTIQTVDFRKNKMTSLGFIYRVAAAITLLIIGVGIGVQFKNNQLQNAEIFSLKQEMKQHKKLLALSLLRQNSASDRIKGVNISLEENYQDDQILDALIERMNVDQNINVQLKAVEGLAQFGYHKKTIAAYLKALNNTEKPELQIAIIDILVQLKVKEAYPKFQDLLNDEATIDAVKNEAASGMEVLL